MATRHSTDAASTSAIVTTLCKEMFQQSTEVALISAVVIITIAAVFIPSNAVAIVIAAVTITIYAIVIIDSDHNRRRSLQSRSRVELEASATRYRAQV